MVFLLKEAGASLVNRTIAVVIDLVSAVLFCLGRCVSSTSPPSPGRTAGASSLFAYSNICTACLGCFGSTGAIFVNDTIAVVVELVATYFFDVVIGGGLADPFAVKNGFPADSFAAVVELARTAFIDNTIAVVVELIPAALGRAITGGSLTNSCLVTNGLRANSHRFACEVARAVFVDHSVAVVVELISALLGVVVALGFCALGAAVERSGGAHSLAFTQIITRAAFVNSAVAVVV